MTTTVPKCKICGTGEPEHPAALHPVCHACRCALDRYRDHTLDDLLGCERKARCRLHLAVVNLRRVHAARVGVAKIAPYYPSPEHRGTA